MGNNDGTTNTQPRQNRKASYFIDPARRGIVPENSDMASLSKPVYKPHSTTEVFIIHNLSIFSSGSFQVEGLVFQPGLARLDLSEFTCEVQFQY